MIYAGSVIVGVVSIVLMFAMFKYIWTRKDWQIDKDGWPPDLCGGGWREPKLRGCEKGYITTGIPVEPVSAYSCVMYPAAAWVALQSVGGGPAVVFFVTMTFLGFGSAAYHGVKTQWAGKWDDAGMYAVFAGLGIYAMVVGHSWETWIMLAAAATAAVLLTYFVHGNLIGRMGTLLAFTWAGVFTSGDVRLGLYSIGLFALAMTAWQLDKRSGLLGRFGHGIWHVFTAIAMAVLFAAIA